MGVALRSNLPQRRTSGEGFSMVETLVASLLVLTIAIGVLPMFTRATINNASGFDYTRVTNEARSRAEEFFQMPFNAEALRLQTGTERAYDEYYAMNDDVWRDGDVAAATAAGDTPLWTRTTVIRQFNVDDLTTPLDETAREGLVHVKEIAVRVAPVSLGGAVGVRKQVSLRLLKSS